MSNYTTGEIAKLAGITVRTVQYYDSRGILMPSDFSEGGRRLYTEKDLKKLKLICFLRELDIPINSISEILSSDNAEKVVGLLLEQQLLVLLDIRKELKDVKNFSIENLNDIAYRVKTKKKLKRLHIITLILGILLEIIETGSFVFGIVKGVWWPFIIGLTIVVILSVVMVKYYYDNVAYICPECHEVFRPKFGQFF